MSKQQVMVKTEDYETVTPVLAVLAVRPCTIPVGVLGSGSTPGPTLIYLPSVATPWATSANLLTDINLM